MIHQYIYIFRTSPKASMSRISFGLLTRTKCYASIIGLIIINARTKQNKTADRPCDEWNTKAKNMTWEKTHWLIYCVLEIEKIYNWLKWSHQWNRTFLNWRIWLCLQSCSHCQSQKKSAESLAKSFESIIKSSSGKSVFSPCEIYVWVLSGEENSCMQDNGQSI